MRMPPTTSRTRTACVEPPKSNTTGGRSLAIARVVSWLRLGEPTDGLATLATTSWPADTRSRQPRTRCRGPGLGQAQPQRDSSHKKGKDGEEGARQHPPPDLRDAAKVDDLVHSVRVVRAVEGELDGCQLHVLNNGAAGYGAASGASGAGQWVGLHLA